MEPRLSYSDLFPAFLREVFRPRKQVFQEVQTGALHMLRNLRQQMLQIFVDLQLVRLGRFHQAIDNSTGLRTVDGVNDVPVRDYESISVRCVVLRHTKYPEDIQISVLVLQIKDVPFALRKT